MSPPRLRIAIVGGGPAGLTLGLLLHKRGIPFIIFELRQKPTPEELAKPAGSLDLHQESGLAAIRGCDLFDEFSSLTGDCTEAQRISNKDGNIIYTDEGELSNRPEISRHKLTELLLSHLPASLIKWGHKLLGAKSSTASGHTEIELDFGQNGKQTFDLVIGADGAWSRVRTLLTDVNPQYAGVQFITLNIRQITTRYPHLAELVGLGSFACLGDRHGVSSQRSVQDVARIYIMISTEDEHFATTTGLSSKTPAQAKGKLIDGGLPFSRWGTNIKELVAVACDDESAANPSAHLDIMPLYSLPVGHSWEHRPCVTLIGDAAHLMCPWAGEGVNLAMKDSLLLSQAIIKAHEIAGQDAVSLQDALDPLMKEFEANMMAGAKEEAQGTVENGKMMFGSDDGATALAHFFKSHGYEAIEMPTADSAIRPRS
ncbi:salicylate hydroxylase [Rhizodiscina lignyota]|uniref:Salicylate hydroxylase n=1 Tax=Rhizodiscina lignyota TaxID=1504668 RepID=A0A9P4I871_9PEZI|nr:salicylate hydroxylase [Rhizodiscina lignyota]